MTAATSPRRAAIAQRLRTELAGAFVLAALLVVFFREPILRYSEVTYTTADLTQNFSLTKIDRDYVANNVLLSDPVTQFVPWLLFNRSELSNGRVPLWNPYNGCGAPHLANYQSAVFSPFSLLFYVCSLKFALLASAFLKLFLAGFGTFLFLRMLALSWLPALLGGATFMFSGFNTLLVAYPHSGVIAFMPFSLLCAESLLQSFERDQRNGTRTRRTGTWLAFVLLLAASIYAGHPEILLFNVFTLAAWIAARLGGWWWLSGHTRAAFTKSLAAGARFVAGGLLAAGLGAPQLATFIEYVALSTKLDVRAAAPIRPLDVESWPRYFFPDLLGSPANNPFAPAVPPPNYEAATLGYVGAIALLLAVLALPRAFRDRRFAPLAAISAVWFVWAHDFFAAARALDRIPHVIHVPIAVSQGPWVFAIGCCAAFTVQSWLDGTAKRGWLSGALTSLVGMAALWFFHDGAREYVASAIERLKPPAAAIATSNQHLQFVASSFLLALAACAAIQLVKSRAVRIACAAVVFGVVCAQTGWLLSFHNTACEDRFVYPLSPAVERVRNTVVADRALIMGREGIPPCSNMVYGLELAANYDGLHIRAYDELYVELFRPDTNWRHAHWANEAALRTFGIRWLLMRVNPPNVDSATTPSATHFDGDKSVLTPRGRVGQHEFFRYAESPGAYWFVSSARAPSSVEKAFERVRSPEFDPSREVVLGPDLPPEFGDVRRRSNTSEPAQPEGRVAVLERLPMRVRLRVAHERDAYLVLTLPWYPGWTATVDGQHVALARANYAFSALDVPAGEHEIVLSYEPHSWIVGLRIAMASLLVLAIATLMNSGVVARLLRR